MSGHTRVPAWGVLAFVVAGVFALGVSATRAADDELVQLLLKQGRTALEKQKPDDAIAKFRKALEEDADCVEAYWWLGQALEKKAAPVEAADAYRAAGPALGRRGRAGRVAETDTSTAKKATARLEALVPGEVELRRLTEAFVADAVELAKANLEKDPAAAKKAVEAALRAAPDDPAANDVAKRLGVTAGPPASADSKGALPALADFKTWDDLRSRKAFESELLAYEPSAMTHECVDGGEIVWADPPPEVGERYVLELEYRMVQRHRANWLVGWSFFRAGRQFVSVASKASGVELYRRNEDEKSETLEDVEAAAPKEPDAWRRLVVVVDGRRVVATLDGKRAFDHTMSEEVPDTGRVGVWTQYCKAEYRVVRVGRP